MGKYGANELVYIRGKVKWFKDKVPNEWGKWSHQIWPDEASMEIIRDLKDRGLKNDLKKDEDGYSMNFSRKTEQEFRGGRKQANSPPVVLKDNGKDVQPTILLEQVGDGSDVTTKLTCYRYGPGGVNLAARWESTMVHNLVPFNPDDFDGSQKIQVRGLTEQPRW